MTCLEHLNHILRGNYICQNPNSGTYSKSVGTEYVRDDSADYEKAEYENSTIKDKIRFYNMHSDLIDLVNGDMVICNPKEESYFDSDLLSEKGFFNPAIASVNAYMESLHDLRHFYSGDCIKLPSKTRYYFLTSEIKCWLTAEQLKKLNCQNIDDEILYFDLQDLASLPSWGDNFINKYNPEYDLKKYGFPDELAARCIFYFQLNIIEFQEYQECI